MKIPGSLKKLLKTFRKQNKKSITDSSMPEQPYGTKISRMDNRGIEFYWKKPERAQGYEVFRSYDSEGEFERIAVIESRKTGSYIDDEFDRRKRSVFYSVRSFIRKDDGTLCFSDRTSPVAAEYRETAELEIENIYLYSGATRRLHAYHGWGEMENPSWKSDDESVAIIDDSGMITAVSKGNCCIICTNENGTGLLQAKVFVDRDAPEPLGTISSRFEKHEGTWRNPVAQKSDEAVIMMVGDLMCGKRQMSVQYSPDEGWNFNESFKYIRDIITEADLSVCNVETLLASGWPYMIDECYINNMNNCNAPSRFLDAVKYGGFDVSTMANNHNCDGGVKALMQTIDQTNRYKMINTGVFKEDGEQRFALVDVNGIKVGILAYMTLATTFNGKDRDWTQEEKDRHLNIYYRDRAEKDIRECRAAGAEYVIAYMHWGQKNFLSTTIGQRNDAAEIAELGVDYIVGANPHVIQNYQLIKTSDGRKVPCFYSIGNFLSIMNQVKGNRDSVIVRIKLKKDAEGQIVLAENGYIPCFCYRKIEDDNWVVVAVDNKHNTDVEKSNRKSIYNRIVSRIGKDISPY